MIKKDPGANRLDRQLERMREKKESFDKKQEIRDMRRQMHRFEKPETSKIAMIFLLLNFTAVEVFSMWIMWYLADASALYALITTVLAEPLSYAIYCAKSYNGKKQEENVKLERDKLELEYGNGVSPADSGMDESADPEREVKDEKEV